LNENSRKATVSVIMGPSCDTGHTRGKIGIEFFFVLDVRGISFRSLCAACRARVAECCSVLQRGALWCIVLYVLQCAAACCSVLHCVAVCCSVMQCVRARAATCAVAVCCSMLEHVLCHALLQCVAAC